MSYPVVDGNFDYSRHYSWIGAPLSRVGDRVYYSAVRTKDDGCVIGVNDTVELLSGEGRLPFLALAESFWEDTATGLWKLRTRWYYRPEDLPEKLMAEYPLGRPLRGEVFLSGERDDNDVQSILGKALVLGDGGDLQAAAAAVTASSHTFILRCHFNPGTGKFEVLAAAAGKQSPLQAAAGTAVAPYQQQQQYQQQHQQQQDRGSMRLDEFAATASYMQRQAPLQQRQQQQHLQSDSAGLGSSRNSSNSNMSALQQLQSTALQQQPRYTLEQRDLQLRMTPVHPQHQHQQQQQQQQQQQLELPSRQQQHFNQYLSEHQQQQHYQQQQMQAQQAAQQLQLQQLQRHAFYNSPAAQSGRALPQQQQRQSYSSSSGSSSAAAAAAATPWTALSGAAAIAERLQAVAAQSADRVTGSGSPVNTKPRKYAVSSGSSAAPAAGAFRLGSAAALAAATAAAEAASSAEALNQWSEEAGAKREDTAAAVVVAAQFPHYRDSSSTASPALGDDSSSSRAQRRGSGTAAAAAGAAGAVAVGGIGAANPPSAGSAASPGIQWVLYTYPGLLTSMEGDVRRASFLQSMRQWYSMWTVRPDVVLRPWRAQPDEKNPTAEYWQDYKKVRIDWRERAGCTKGHFILIVQHYMRIDGVYKDTFKRSINNIISRIKVFTTRKRKRLLREAGLSGRKVKPLNPLLKNLDPPPLPPAKQQRLTAGGSASPYEGGPDGEGDDVELGGADSGDDKDSMMDSSARNTAVGSRGGGAGMSAAVAKVYTGEETVRLRGKHWWEEETLEGGPTLLYPTSDTHQWSSHNAIEHRIMEVEFEDGNDLRPPKDSLVEFALKWRPDSLFRYVMGLNTDTEPLGRLQGMYQRQEALRSGRYWYKLVPGPGVATFSVEDPSAATAATAAVPTVSAASTVESAVTDGGGSEQDSDSPPAAADVAAKDSDVASDVADSADAAAAADGSASDSTTAADTAAGEQSGAVNGTADADTAVAGKEDAPMAKSSTTKSGRGRKARGRGGSASAARSTRSANSTAAAGGAAGAAGGGGSDSSSSNGTGSSANAAAAVGGSSSGSGAAASDAPARRATNSNSNSSNSNSSSTSTALTVTLDAELIWLDSANSYVLRALCPAGGSALAAATAARIPAQRCSLQEIPRWAEGEETGGQGGGWGDAGHLLVRGCMSLFPPRQMLLYYGLGAVRAICTMVWQGCFRANPDRVAFSLFCRLLIARESPDSAEVSEEVAAEFDARKFAILRTFLALRLEEGEFVARHHYLAFMEWVLCTAPEQPFVVKVLRLWEVLMEGDLPFAGYPISSSNLALKHHWEILGRGGAPGRYCFRFSNKTGHITVDYTIMEGAGRSGVSVASRRLQVIELNSDSVLFRADAGAPDDTSTAGDAPTAGPTAASTAGATEFTNLTDFVRAWSSRFVVKCETGHLIDTHVLRWQAS